MNSQDKSSRKLSVRQQIFLLGVVLTLANLAAILHKSSRIFLFQQSQCLAYYLATDPTKVDGQSRVEEALCKLEFIQSRLSIIDGFDSFLSCLPGMSFSVSSYLALSTILTQLMKMHLGSVLTKHEYFADIRSCNGSTAGSRAL